MDAWEPAWTAMPYALLVLSLLAVLAFRPYGEGLAPFAVATAGLVLSGAWVLLSRAPDWDTRLWLLALATVCLLLVVACLWAAVQAYRIARSGSAYWSRAFALAWAWVSRSSPARAMEPSPVSRKPAVRTLLALPPARVSPGAWDTLLREWSDWDRARFATEAHRPGIPERVWWALATAPEPLVRKALQVNPGAPDYARAAAALLDPDDAG